MRSQPTARILLFTAAAVADADREVVGTPDDPAGLLLELAPDGARVLARDRRTTLRSHPAAKNAELVARPGCVLVPGLINAHTHLDLTAIGPRPVDPEAPFTRWIDMVRRERPSEPDRIRQAVDLGVRMSQRGGVVAVGDIAGAVGGLASPVATEAMAEAGLAGVSFVEFFAIGHRSKERLAVLEQTVRTLANRPLPTGFRIGIQPHAPNTVERSAYDSAIALANELSLPLMTHLAESADEQRFIAESDGPQRELLDRLGLWEDRLQGEFGRGRSPVRHLERQLRRSAMTAVHLNACSDDDIDLLRDTGTPIVYCPRASDLFGAPARFGPHRYRDMLAAGLTVALGTDSIIGLPTGTDRLSTLDEMRYLRARDGVEPLTLLRLATTNAARAIGMLDHSVRFCRGDRPLGVLAIETDSGTLAGALASHTEPEILWTRNSSGETGI
ncbi:MAG: amidohydrolase family protein [Phycisphaerales bacterium]